MAAGDIIQSKTGYVSDTARRFSKRICRSTQCLLWTALTRDK